jgi:hypothetical protein
MTDPKMIIVRGCRLARGRMNAPFEILIDPARLLLVGLQSGDGDIHTFVAVVCRFLVVRRPNIPPRVAVEILFDPDEQEPTAPYYCDRARMVRRLAAPGRVKQVRPYALAGLDKQYRCIKCDCLLSAFGKDNSSKWSCTTCKVDGTTVAMAEEPKTRS